MSHHHGPHGPGRHRGRREMRGAERPFGRHGHRHGGGRGRPFEQGELRFVLLQMIAEAPRHGYELIKAIEEKFGGAYAPSPGVVYPTLTMLEEMGYATLAAAEGGKKLYAATPEGIAHLEANRATVDAVQARMQAARGGIGAPPIIRAMENLKLALRLRLSGEAIDEERIRKIAAAIDAAAVEIERS
ncbi:MAG: PadR family transcriptional regulator [Alphaproteobacteria bacterium]